MSGFPSRLSDNAFGKSVVATEDLPPGTRVERFRGEVRRFEELPEEEIIYVISFEPARGPFAASGVDCRDVFFGQPAV